MDTVREFSTEELAESLADSWEAIPPSIVKVTKSLLDLLEHGKPVAPNELASATGLKLGLAVQLARRIGSEFDEEGNIIGWGLSLVPTPHKYSANGKDLFAWCAADTISFPSMLNHSAVIESPDPISGEIVRLTVSSEGVEDLEPSSAVVSWSLKSDMDDIRGSFCNLVHFFASRETASEYVSEHAGLVIASVEGVFEAAKSLTDKEEFKILLEA